AGVVEQADIGALELIAEVLHQAPKFCLVEIELCGAANEREAERTQGIGHQTRIVCRIAEPRHVHVSGIANDQRHAPVRQGWRGIEGCPKHEDEAKCGEQPALRSHESPLPPLSAGSEATTSFETCQRGAKSSTGWVGSNDYARRTRSKPAHVRYGSFA